MSYVEPTLLIGASMSAVRVRLTPAAIRLLQQLPSGEGTTELADHRSLLTTIAVGKAAAGDLVDLRVVVDVADILEVLDHAGKARGDHAIRPDER